MGTKSCYTIRQKKGKEVKTVGLVWVGCDGYPSGHPRVVSKGLVEYMESNPILDATGVSAVIAGSLAKEGWGEYMEIVEDLNEREELYLHYEYILTMKRKTIDLTVEDGDGYIVFNGEIKDFLKKINDKRTTLANLS